MNWRLIFVGAFLLIIFASLFFYMLPTNPVSFEVKYNNTNFSIDGSSVMQYYPNMRFSSPDISYRISSTCPLQKQNDMENAFTIMENLTPLVFYPVDNNEEITVTCEDRNQIENGMFVAGEGGPKQIIVAGNFNIITSGEILLIRNSDCPKPNIAIHELLHVLGFNHSVNPANIMYNVSNCDQTIGDDTLKLLNDLYSIPSYPDLIFENASATMSGRFLNLDMNILNVGLADANSSDVAIYADNNLIRKIDINPVEIGNGISLHISNIWVAQLNVNNINLVIETNFSEINKENNKITLGIR